MPSLLAASLAVAALSLIVDPAVASSAHSGALARGHKHVKERSSKVMPHTGKSRTDYETCATKLPNSKNISDCPSFGPPSPYNLVLDSSGPDFFDNWNFFTDPDPTHGNVDYQPANTSWAEGLVSVGPNSLLSSDITQEPITARMKVDDTTVLSPGQNRKSVRIISKTSFMYGLLILDAVKMPFGCSTWPAFWTLGPDWPNGGEIDIVEGVNLKTDNVMVLHTAPGCTLNKNMTGSATGNVLATTCDVNINYNTGCGVDDTASNSYGSAFNAVGGGVFAMEWDVDGISIWRFERKDVPWDIRAKVPTPSLWGPPVAFWSATTCNMAKYFAPQNIIFDTTICGDYAGSVFNTTGCSGTCTDLVPDPNNYKDAKWEVASVRVYGHDSY